MKKALILALMIDAAVVFVGLLGNHNMWAFIVAYWAILTAKNMLDAVD